MYKPPKIRHGIYGRIIGSGMAYDYDDSDEIGETELERQKIYDNIMIPKGTTDKELAAKCCEVKVYKLGGA